MKAFFDSWKIQMKGNLWTNLLNRLKFDVVAAYYLQNVLDLFMDYKFDVTV